MLPSVVIYSLYTGMVFTSGYLEPLTTPVYRLPKAFLIHYLFGFSLCVGGNLFIYPVLTSRMTFLVHAQTPKHHSSAFLIVLGHVHGISDICKQYPKSPQATAGKLP